MRGEKVKSAVLAALLATTLGSTPALADGTEPTPVVVLADEAMDRITAGLNVFELFKGTALKEWTGSKLPDGVTLYLSVPKSGSWTNVSVVVGK